MNFCENFERSAYQFFAHTWDFFEGTHSYLNRPHVKLTTTRA